MSEEKIVVVGVVLSIVSMVVQQLIGISSPFIGGAIVGGGIVLTIIAINRSISRGGCAWLLNQ